MTCALRAVLFLCFAVPPILAQDSFDSGLFLAINQRLEPGKTGFVEILDYTSLPTFGAVSPGFLLTGILSNNSETVRAGVLTGVGQVAALGVTLVLKDLVGRPRPYEALPGVRTKHVWSAGGSSFPSGHVSQAFAIATTLSLQYRTAAITLPLYLWATAIGYGRIYLGLHYPSDVLGGMLVGMAAGFLAWSIRGDLHRIADKIVSPDPALQTGGGFTRVFLVQIPLR
ncbi:MAG: hypothetical protein HBSIN02_21010 [Bacteroidia bacterium]|nr:MAG: hypothetical protein HBSIN02_21010 [Bacteroidia bacterium]